MISKIPARIAQNAITYSKAIAVMAGQAKVSTPAMNADQALDEQRPLM
jgi:hypothetical protein